MDVICPPNNEKRCIERSLFSRQIELTCAQESWLISSGDRSIASMLAWFPLVLVFTFVLPDTTCPGCCGKFWLVGVGWKPCPVCGCCWKPVFGWFKFGWLNCVFWGWLNWGFCGTLGWKLCAMALDIKSRQPETESAWFKPTSFCGILADDVVQTFYTVVGEGVAFTIF